MQKYVRLMEKESYKSLVNIQIIKNLVIIAITQVNMEMQHIVFVI